MIIKVITECDLAWWLCFVLVGSQEGWENHNKAQFCFIFKTHF